MSEKQIAVPNRCAFANWTGEKWPCSFASSKCEIVECSNPARNSTRPDFKRTDGAAFHSRWPDALRDATNAERATAPFIWIRSGYCRAKHCVDYIPADGGE